MIILHIRGLPEYACLLKISVSMTERVTQTVHTNIEMTKIIQFFHTFIHTK